MKLRQGLAVTNALGLLFYSVPAKAVPIAPYDISQAVAQLQADTQLLAGWEDNQLRYVIPFNSTAGNVVPSQFHVFGFEVGVEGVATSTKLDVNGLRTLPTSIIDTKQIDTFSRLPFPNALAHAKIGLPFGMDIGVRVGGIPKESYTSGDTKLSIKNTILGFDLRKKIIEEGTLKPFGLTLGLNFTDANGSGDTSTPYTSQGVVNVNGNAYNSSLAASGTNHSTWDTKSWGLQAILDKQIVFFTPYIGASVNRNFGSLSSSVGSSGTETITDPNNSANTAQSNFSEVGTTEEGPNKWDVRALIGVEFSFFPFVRLGINGEYAGNKNMAADLGLRFQF